MKLELVAIRELKHSGIGDNATHLKVIEAFKKSIDDGIYYCKQRGWEVDLTNILLTVKSGAMFGFQFVASIKKVD